MKDWICASCARGRGLQRNSGPEDKPVFSSPREHSVRRQACASCHDISICYEPKAWRQKVDGIEP